MDNKELMEAMKQREQAHETLKQELEALEGESPMSLAMGGMKKLGGLVNQLNRAFQLNDLVLKELAIRELERNG
ncbi:hypothetical protein [Marinomonas fungiae]|uniref:hypothetical protein n=1 Tax=Marinomonas fungiae TaxID=1137284 RepID=UPI003A8CF629